jgi:hypothetical protein
MEQLVSFDLREGLITANYSSTDTNCDSGIPGFVVLQPDPSAAVRTAGGNKVKVLVNS